MQDREKLTKLFDAVLQEMDASGNPPAAAAVMQPLPFSDQPQQQQQAQAFAGPQFPVSAEQQEYAARQRAYELQQEYARQQQLYAQQQEYALQQQAYAQQQAILAQQQAYAQQQAEQLAHARHQAYLQQQAEQLAYARQQQAAAQNDPYGLGESGDLLSAEPEPEIDVQLPVRENPAEEPPATFGFTVPAAASGSFVFTKKEEADSNEHPGMQESEEFATIMDAKMAKARRKNGRSFLFTMILFGGPTLGGAGWFVSNPDRVDALRATVSEIRSAGDIKAIMAKYQKSLDKVAVRGKHIDEATSMMGIDPAAEAGPGDDAHFEEEMKKMSGPDGGPTITERNRKLREKFGDVKNGGGLMGKKVPAAE